MTISNASKTSVYYFRQRTDITQEQWTELCHVVTKAHRLIRQQPATTGYPDIVICHNGGRTLHHDDSLIGPGIIVFNGPTQQSGDTFVLSRFVSRPRRERCDTGGHPYDFLVRVVFLLAEHFCPDSWEITADIPQSDWQQSADWIAQYLNIMVRFPNIPAHFVSQHDVPTSIGRSIVLSSGEQELQRYTVGNADL